MTAFWKCRDCGRQFTVTVGTIYENAKSLAAWLRAEELLALGAEKIGMPRLAYILDVSKATAYRIRKKLQESGRIATTAASRNERLRPVPSAEQKENVERIRSELLQLARIEKQMEQWSREMDRLRETILKHAIESNLVPQNMSKVPALVLLQRIREELAPKERTGSKPLTRESVPTNQRQS